MARPRLALAMVLALVGAVVFGLVGLGAGGAAAAPDRYVLPGDNVFPEGIATTPDGRTFYVGSTTSGAVFRGDVASGEVEVFLPGGSDGRTDVRGLKVGSGKLYLAGGPTGRIYVYDIAGKRLLAQFATGLTPTFVNDVAIAPSGDAYFTDSNSPAIYRVAADVTGGNAFERWLDLSGSPIQYGQGFNLNGIAASADGRYLVTVQSNTGKLFRIETGSKRVSEIDLGGATLMGGDGLLLNGQTLSVLRNSAELLVTLRLAPDFASAAVVATDTDPRFDFPTTLARAGDRFLIVNSQLDKRGRNEAPTLPFVILSVPVPGAATPGMPNTGAGGGQPLPPGAGALAAALLAALGGGVGLARLRRRLG